jgi:nitrogen fixation/metabolism regulation signal transduction histidine kinase
VIVIEDLTELIEAQRRAAWSEVARRMAHEIKNPLTPMKLSIQYLQKANMSGAPNVKELTSNVAKTLVEQIDHLSKIASDFSQFAHIGNPLFECCRICGLCIHGAHRAGFRGLGADR